jgi:hypothetical protein
LSRLCRAVTPNWRSCYRESRARQWTRATKETHLVCVPHLLVSMTTHSANCGRSTGAGCESALHDVDFVELDGTEGRKEQRTAFAINGKAGPGA